MSHTQPTGTVESVHITGRHRTESPRGTAYDIVCQNRGVVWVKPDHHRHTAETDTVESFAGDLSDNRDMAVWP